MTIWPAGAMEDDGGALAGATSRAGIADVRRYDLHAWRSVGLPASIDESDRLARGDQPSRDREPEWSRPKDDVRGHAFSESLAFVCSFAHQAGTVRAGNPCVVGPYGLQVLDQRRTRKQG